MNTLQKIRVQALVFLAHKIGLPYFRLFRKKPDFPYTEWDLAQMPETTVGHALYRFYIENEMHLLPYYEKHDIKHVVLNYDATEDGEVCLQCFMLANGRITIPVWIAVWFGIITMPEYFSRFRAAWKRGRANVSLRHVNWFALIPQPLDEVRKQIIVSK